MIVVVFGFFFSLSTLFLCRDIKERPVANLPKEAEALVPSLVTRLNPAPQEASLCSGNPCFNRIPLKMGDPPNASMA